MSGGVDSQVPKYEHRRR